MFQYQHVNASYVRNRVVDTMVRESDRFKFFMEEDFWEYTKRMRQEDEWGGEPELVLLAERFK